MSVPVPSRSLPMVAIVGRANVGKSTLFNRLLRQQRALVQDLPGVTRDRVAAPARFEGREVLLVDTGGLDPRAEDGIWRSVQEQVRRLLVDAELVLFVTSARDGLLPLDASIADLLRAEARSVILVVNKTDNPAQELAAAEFHGLGFEEVLTVSAAHRRGLRDVELSVAERLPAADEREEDSGVPGALALALIGRPNVGKSSLFNRLVRDEASIVDATPGTTRDALDTWIEHDGRPVVLIDTAGLRRAARRGERVERGSAYFSLRAIERADLVLLVIDGSEGVTEQEQRIARIAFDRGRPLVLICNKWDVMDETARRTGVGVQIERRLAFLRDPMVLHTSARTGKGVARILPAAFELMDAVRRTLPTSEVNRVLQEAVERHAPPFAGRRRPRFLYATQVSDRPITILIFVNDPGLVSTAYRRYLVSSFRKHLGLRSAPLRVWLRARRRRDSGAAGPEAPSSEGG